MTVVSSLAEGADRLVVEEAIAGFGAGLIVPLPLPCAEYEKDFASPESRATFTRLLARASEVVPLPPAPARAEAYAAAGRYVEAASDVLLAVWDGRPGQGRAGTAEVVAAARRRGLPLAWVHAGNRRPGTTEAMSLGPEQGTVTFERF
ncbi:MAG TPA: hypothetical protein VKA21_16170 [Candidatus Binatia bacterium]|nr:hypothetical protein [Candidatus Binatia bacterium]